MIVIMGLGCIFEQLEGEWWSGGDQTKKKKKEEDSRIEDGKDNGRSQEGGYG